MSVPIALIEIDPKQVRLYGGWVEVEGMRYRYDIIVQPGDSLAGIDFPALLDHARAGRRLLLEESDGSVTLEPGPDE